MIGVEGVAPVLKSNRGRKYKTSEIYLKKLEEFKNEQKAKNETKKESK